MIIKLTGSEINDDEINEIIDFKGLLSVENIHKKGFKWVKFYKNMKEAQEDSRCKYCSMSLTKKEFQKSINICNNCLTKSNLKKITI
jgi:hypothetical protein